MSTEDRDDVLYMYQQVVLAVDARKAHFLRSVQDKVRTVVLKELDDNSILITQDWAMKFLPKRYREPQADWFAKRGISWHISVIVRKKNGRI